MLDLIITDQEEEIILIFAHR